MSFIGIYYGILNQITWFVLNPVYWWMGILHLPLLINSIIGFIIAIKEEKRYKNQTFVNKTLPASGRLLSENNKKRQQISKMILLIRIK